MEKHRPAPHHSLGKEQHENYIPWKDRKEVAADLKEIYVSNNAAITENFLRIVRKNGGEISYNL
jgi:transposase-like protein